MRCRCSEPVQVPGGGHEEEVHTCLPHCRPDPCQTASGRRNCRTVCTRAPKAIQPGQGSEAEKLARTLLANQFVTGLRAELKRKLIGVEGSLEELVLKARFEEAKGHELAIETSRTFTASKTNKPKGVTPHTNCPITTTSDILESRRPDDNWVGVNKPWEMFQLWA